MGFHRYFIKLFKIKWDNVWKHSSTSNTLYLTGWMSDWKEDILCLWSKLKTITCSKSLFACSSNSGCYCIQNITIHVSYPNKFFLWILPSSQIIFTYRLWTPDKPCNNPKTKIKYLLWNNLSLQMHLCGVLWNYKAWAASWPSNILIRIC